MPWPAQADARSSGVHQQDRSRGGSVTEPLKPGEVEAWVMRVFKTLQEREPDPVEALERAAHFETHKAKK
jgi:hypothetical protein